MRSTQLKRLLHVSTGRNYGSSRSAASDLLHRDMFVFDESWSRSRWSKALLKAVDLNIKDHGNILTNALKHPSSGHIIAQYSLYHFNHSSFHFTSQGEYSLNITAAQSIDCDLVTHTTTAQYEKDMERVMEGDVKDQQGLHSVLLWPENILIRHLRKAQLGSVMDKCFRAKKIDMSALKDTLSSSDDDESSSRVGISKVDRPVVLVSVQAGEYTQASETLASFKRVSDAIIEKGDKDKTKAPLYIMSTEIRGHRNAGRIMVLDSKGGKDLGEGEDVFATIKGEEHIEEVMRKHL